MTYAVQQDLVDRFGSAELAQLTDPVAGVTIDATVVARALSDAQADIDTRLSARYALPLASVPAVLVRVAADLARYYLWDAQASEQVRNRFKDAVSLLDKLASGAVLLSGVAALAPAATAVTVSASAPQRHFGDAAMDAYSPPL